MLLKNFRSGLILMVYAIILLFCNSLYNSYLSANELIIYEKQGFSSKFQDINGTDLDLKNFEGKLIYYVEKQSENIIPPAPDIVDSCIFYIDLSNDLIEEEKIICSSDL